MKNLKEAQTEINRLKKEILSILKDKDVYIKENEKLRNINKKNKNWAKLRSDQVGQLINTLENNSKKEINNLTNILGQIANNLIK